MHLLLIHILVSATILILFEWGFIKVMCNPCFFHDSKTIWARYSYVEVFSHIPYSLKCGEIFTCAKNSTLSLKPWSQTSQCKWHRGVRGTFFDHDLWEFLRDPKMQTFDSNICAKSKPYSKILQRVNQVSWWVGLNIGGYKISWHCPFRLSDVESVFTEKG